MLVSLPRAPAPAFVVAPPRLPSPPYFSGLWLLVVSSSFAASETPILKGGGVSHVIAVTSLSIFNFLILFAPPLLI